MSSDSETSWTETKAFTNYQTAKSCITGSCCRHDRYELLEIIMTGKIVGRRKAIVEKIMVEEHRNVDKDCEYCTIV